MSNLLDQCGWRKVEGGMPDGRPLRAGHSAFPAPFPHRGITLIEVLISMGVLTLGILGVAALFPVGSYYAQRGDIYDRADAAAASALSDAVTRGMVDPERWVSYQSNAGLTQPLVAGTFTRPFAADLRRRLAIQRTSLPDVRQKNIIAESSSIYFIDPVGVSQGVNPNPASNFASDSRLKAVPASFHSSLWMRSTSSAGTSKTAWDPWYGKTPIARISLNSKPLGSGLAIPLSRAGAVAMSTLSDDLALSLEVMNDNPDQPAVALSRTMTIGGASTNLKREAREHFSYLVSVVPRTPEARDALAFGGQGLAYDVSAVVFHRRPQNRYVNGDTTYGGFESLMRSERIARASIVAGAPSGGEVRVLTTNWSPDSVPDELPWKNLKVGNYVFLFGPDPSTSSYRPQLFGQWYRVTAIDDSELQGAVGPSVSLRGPDWPWATSSVSIPLTEYQQRPTDLQDDLRMLIFDGVVAVHTRTMRLDAGTAWSSN